MARLRTCEGCGWTRKTKPPDAPLCKACMRERSAEAILTAIRAIAAELGRTPGKADWERHRKAYGIGYDSGAVRRKFGMSWGSVCVRAGLERNAHGRRLTDAERGEAKPGRNRQMVTAGARPPDGGRNPRLIG